MTHTLDQLQGGALDGAREVKLALGLDTFPEALYALADTLEVLDLSNNALTSLPADMARFTKLRILFASNNPFTTLPPSLGACPNLRMIGFKANRIAHVPAQSLPPSLRWLILTDNAVESLPDRIGQCADMQKLMLAGNRLRTLPASMASLGKLELLRLSANALDALPAWIGDLPRLAWLAYAGNPFNAATEAHALDGTHIARIPWHALTLDARLGEGASGVIHRAILRDDANATAASRAVAVKLFKGAMTSDGLPLNEMHACIRAGGHDGLIPVIGRIDDHPEGLHGLVMELIDPAFGNLAGPPSFDSCTRDIYADDTHFSAEAAVSIARDIGEAARHLHREGIMHGDLYAHNILHDGAGHALLGDFGAASFYSPKAGVHHATDAASTMQRIEVRAFGCLLEELTARIDSPTETNANCEATQRLASLRDRCFAVNPHVRPAFDDIVDALNR